MQVQVQVQVQVQALAHWSNRSNRQEQILEPQASGSATTDRRDDRLNHWRLNRLRRKRSRAPESAA